jgi:hypothetical protein
MKETDSLPKHSGLKTNVQNTGHEDVTKNGPKVEIPCFITME